MVDWSKAQGRPTTKYIGRHLPENERIQVDIWPLSNDDSWMVDFEEAKQLTCKHRIKADDDRMKAMSNGKDYEDPIHCDCKVLQGEERERVLRSVLGKQQKFVAAVTRSELAEIKKISAEVFEEVVEKCLECIAVTDDKRRMMKTLIEESKKNGRS